MPTECAYFIAESKAKMTVLASSSFKQPLFCIAVSKSIFL